MPDDATESLLQGRVLAEGETPPPETIVIEVEPEQEEAWQLDDWIFWQLVWEQGPPKLRQRIDMTLRHADGRTRTVTMYDAVSD